jgi:hypothetical protein
MGEVGVFAGMEAVLPWPGGLHAGDVRSAAAGPNDRVVRSAERLY